MATAAHTLLVGRARRAASAAVRRLRDDERGLGLIELLVAMGVLAIAISAQLAVFASSYTSIGRASMKGTAVTLADKQMENYRTLPYSCVYLAAATGDSTYSGDSAYSASQITGSSCSPYTTPATSATTASQTVTGPDGRSYRVDTYIVSMTPTGGRALKKVTVVVRAVTNSVVGSVLARQASTFDQALQ
jgi:prepilin-type N-terminal cleavage/methylation domain-containing protein